MNFDLGRMRRLMAALGHPEDQFPSVHIAGTNGKGSTAMMIASALWANQIPAGLYTSPHLEDLSERFQINGHRISESDLSRITNLLRKTVSSNRLGFKTLTQFEFLTAIAFVWFAERRVPIAVVEVGLGGRLDATNVLSRVSVSVVTTIGLDHTQWLGSTIPLVAKEKGGIIRSSTSVVTGARGPALTVLKKIAQSQRAPLVMVSEKGTKPSLRHMEGAYQALNARLALKTLNLLRSEGFSLNKWGIIRGLQKARWPGRFERFYVRFRGQTRRIILDGAHNPHAMAALMRALDRSGDKNIDVVFGVLKDKDVDGLVKTLSPRAHRVVLAPVPSARGLDPTTLSRNRFWARRPSAAMSPVEALKRLLSEEGKNTILITGSLYLIGALRSWVVKHRAHRN